MNKLLNEGETTQQRSVSFVSNLICCMIRRHEHGDLQSHKFSLLWEADSSFVCFRGFNHRMNMPLEKQRRGDLYTLVDNQAST